MRRRLIRWALTFAQWLDPDEGIVLVQCPKVYRDAATTERLLAERRFGAGFGDAKRRDVYAALQKQFPEAPKSQLALAIELAT